MTFQKKTIDKINNHY